MKHSTIPALALRNLRCDYVTLDVATLMSAIGEACWRHHRNHLEWTEQHIGEELLTICYYSFPDPDEMSLWLELLRLSPTKSPLNGIEIQGFPEGEGRVRWLFKCRMTNNGRPCDNHVKRLFFPVDDTSMRKGFGCARCHQIADPGLAVLRGATDEMTWWR